LGNSWSSAPLKHGYSVSIPFTMPRITEDLTLLCVLTFSSSVKLCRICSRGSGQGRQRSQSLRGVRDGSAELAASSAFAFMVAAGRGGAGLAREALTS
jgi:hypothetical protein